MANEQAANKTSILISMLNIVYQCLSKYHETMNIKIRRNQEVIPSRSHWPHRSKLALNSEIEQQYQQQYDPHLFEKVATGAFQYHGHNHSQACL